MEISSKSRNIMKNKVIFSSKKKVAIVIDDIETTFLDEMMLRFPHIVQDVFKELDNKSLANCRNVSRACCDFIDNEKFYWVRNIQNYVSMKNFLQQWQKVLRNTPIENIKDIFVTIKQFVEYDLSRKKKQFSPLKKQALKSRKYSFFSLNSCTIVRQKYPPTTCLFFNQNKTFFDSNFFPEPL